MKRALLYILAITLLLVPSCEKSNGEGGGNGDLPDISTAYAIEVTEITASCATVDVRATVDSGYFYFDVIESEVLTAFGSPRDLAQQWVKHIFKLIEEYNAYGDEEYTFTEFLSRGSDNYHYKCDLSPKTKYTVVAFDVDSKGNVGENISIAEFATREVRASNNNFKITIEGTTASIDASIKEEYYLFNIYKSEALESLSEQQIISRLIYDAIDFGISDSVMGGGIDQADYADYLTNATRFSAVCVGYDGGATTSLTRHDFLYTSDSADDDAAHDLFPGTSTLKANVDFRGEQLRVVHQGDLYKTGAKVYSIILTDNEGNTGFTIEICSDAARTTFEGTYHTAQQIGVANSMLRGYQRNDDYRYGSWFVNAATNELSAAVEGVTTILLNGDNIIVNVEWTDENGVKVIGSYSGKYALN